MVEKLTESLAPVIEKLNFKLVKVSLEKVDGELVLEVIIDKEDGVNIDDCVLVTKAINPVLDELDLIESSYTLEVASKGVSIDE